MLMILYSHLLISTRSFQDPGAQGDSLYLGRMELCHRDVTAAGRPALYRSRFVPDDVHLRSPGDLPGPAEILAVQRQLDRTQRSGDHRRLSRGDLGVVVGPP